MDIMQCATKYAKSTFHSTMAECWRQRTSFNEGDCRDKEGNIVPLHAMKENLAGRSITPLILKLCTRRRWAVNDTPQMLYPGEKEPSTHWTGSWVGLEPVWMFWREKNLLLLVWKNDTSSSPQPHYYTDYPAMKVTVEDVNGKGLVLLRR
jgi:hypothetical protein